MNPRLLALSILMLLSMAASPPGYGQVLPVGDVFEDYARFLQLKGQIRSFSFGVRPLPVQALYGSLDPLEVHPWLASTASLRGVNRSNRFALAILDPEIRSFWNTTRPLGVNDGAVWQGRGGTFMASAGAFLKAGPLSAAFKPALWYTQNDSFQLWPGTSYRYQPATGSIDLPQRFGPDPFTALDLGPSYARIDYKGLALGLSNEGLWWGPALYNPLVMSNNAPGFPHAFLGTSAPLPVGIGALEGRWIWGRLSESDYFDNNPNNDSRLITGIVLDFSPAFAPGLSLGFARVYTLLYPEELTWDHYLLAFQHPFKKRTTQVDESDRKDQILSVYLRWLVPDTGFEVYGELGRGDHSADLRDLIVELEHATGYTLGLQKAFTSPWGHDMRLSAELTRLQDSKTAMLRGAGPFYVHSQVPQGYTHRGQILGAGIGPGSNAQSLGLDWFESWGKAGLLVQRVTRDANRFYRTQEPIIDSEDDLEVEIATGAHAYVFIGRYELGASLTFSRLLNQQYVYKNDASNINASVTLRRLLMGYR